MDPNTSKQIARELLPFVRVYEDGSVERLMLNEPNVPPSPNPDPKTGISSKDVVISETPSISTRVFLPKIDTRDEKIPILVYYHGGAFCIASAFSPMYSLYVNILLAHAKVIVVMVEYRLAPEHLLPAAYDDSWAALNWVTSHSTKTETSSHNKEPWISNYGDFSRLYIGGESAGANIVHNIAMRAGSEVLEGDVKILGAHLTHPLFWGSKPIGSESVISKPYLTDSLTIESSDTGVSNDKALPGLVWNFVYPEAPWGLDNPQLNPEGHKAPSLSKLGCSRILISVAGDDELRDRGARYYDLLKESGWGGEIVFHEVEGVGHGFFIFDTESDKSIGFYKRIASFLSM